jgi:hypothetical protein
MLLSIWEAMLSGVERLYNVSSVISEKIPSLDPTIRATMYPGWLRVTKKAAGKAEDRETMLEVNENQG